MSSLFGGGGGSSSQATTTYVTQPATVIQAAASPTVDEATTARNSKDRKYNLGRAATVLTGDNGLPNLGSVSSPAASALSG